MKDAVCSLLMAVIGGGVVFLGIALWVWLPRAGDAEEDDDDDDDVDSLLERIDELEAERPLLLLLANSALDDAQMAAAFANAGESALYKAVIQTIEQEREIVAHRARTAGNPDERAVEVGGERALNLLREVLVRKVVEATRKAAS